MNLEELPREENDYEVFDANSSPVNSDIQPNNQPEEDSSTKKALTAIGRGAAAYVTGGESLGADKEIINIPAADKLIGVISDTAEKVPGVEALADELNESGVSDLANDAMDLAGDIKKGDIGGIVESAKKVKQDKKKTNKYIKKKVVVPIAIAIGTFAFLLLIVVSVCAPVLGGFINVTDNTGDGAEVVNVDPDKSSDLEDIYPDSGNLTDARQAILSAAASVLGRKYNWGGHPSGGGLDNFPNNGVDCAGYVQWVLWTALGENPGYLTTASISDLIGTKFIEISASELQPGDIGLKFKGVRAGAQNHTGIYAGGNTWMHAKGAKYGIVRGNYSGFTVFLRYVGVT